MQIVLCICFKPVLQEEGGEGAPSPPTPGLVYKKAWNETP